MKKLIASLIFLSLAITPALAFAHPGALDQYGGHVCLDNCSLWGVEQGEYHYHYIPQSPAYLNGYMKKDSIDYVFYFPTINSAEITHAQYSFLGNDLNELVKNPAIDVRFCEDAKIFAGGYYDQMNRARIRPACAQAEDIVLNDATISPANYYMELPGKTDREITKAYHFEINPDGKRVFIEKPEIEDLLGLLVQGETDPSIYYVDRYTQPIALRKITEEKARFIYGENYQEKIAYFDDSIVYSYFLGKPLY